LQDAVVVFQIPHLAPGKKIGGENRTSLLGRERFIIDALDEIENIAIQPRRSMAL
jgi:hypothetical protein